VNGESENVRKGEREQGQSRLWPVASLVALVILGGLAYGHALSLPFFWDDIAHMGWMREHTLMDVWGGPQWGAYYRPLPFSLWMILHALQGAHVAGVQHAVNVAVHVLNAALVAGVFWLQTSRAHYDPTPSPSPEGRGVLSPLPIGEGLGVGKFAKPLTALLAGVAFLLFPFSFQAVVPVNSLTHPLHTSITLLAVVLAVLGARRGTPALVWLAAGVSACAILAHENGILAPALALWSVMLLPAQDSLKHRIRAFAWPFAGALVVAFGVWRVSHAGDAPFTLALFNDPRGLFSIAYFLQGLAFAPAALVVPLQRALNAPDAVPLIFALGALFVFAWLGLAAWLKAGRAALWALGWFAAAVLPAALLLDFAYVEQSPRLMYLASVGAACFLVAPLAGCAQTLTQKIGVAVAGIVVLVSLAWSLAFLQTRAALYAMLGDSIRGLGQAVASDGCNTQDNALAINFPEWFFVASPEYPLGRDGIKTVAEQGGLSALYEANFNAVRVIDAAVLPDVQAPAQPYVSFGTPQAADGLQPALRDAGTVLLGAFDGQTVRVRPAGCRLPQPASVTLATFGDGLILNSARATRTGDAVTVVLDWHLQSTLPEDSTIFLHVVNGAGQLVAQADGAPVAGASPLRLWPAGAAWRDVRHVTVTDAAALRVLAGVYRAGDGNRLPAVDANGNRLPDDAMGVDVNVAAVKP
jgi:hypothetical protein